MTAAAAIPSTKQRPDSAVSPVVDLDAGDWRRLAAAVLLRALRDALDDADAAAAVRAWLLDANGTAATWLGLLADVVGNVRGVAGDDAQWLGLLAALRKRRRQLEGADGDVLFGGLRGIY